MALASISRVRIAALQHEKKRGAEDAAFMKDRMEQSLAVIQVGITLLGACAAALGGAGMEASFAPFLQKYYHVSDFVSKVITLIIWVLPLSFVTVLFAELIPKVFSLKYKEWVLLMFSPVMRFLSIVMYPVIIVFEFLVKKTIALAERQWKPAQDTTPKKQSLYDLRAAASLARSSFLLGAREEKIIDSAAHMTLRPIRDIIIPAVDISMIPVSSSLADAFIRAHLDMHTRFPVCTVEHDPQTIIGYVNFKDILVALKVSPSEPNIRGITRVIKRVKETVTQSLLLEQMIQEKSHIVLVVSDQGSVLGLVTMEDILEELVGEIEDEFDRLPTHIHPSGSYWVIGGGVSMTSVASMLGIGFDYPVGQPIPSLAEWCQQKTGGNLKGGEAIIADGIWVMPRKFRRKKVSEATVSLSLPKNP